MNGRTLAGLALLVVGLGLAGIGGYNLVDGTRGSAPGASAAATASPGPATTPIVTPSPAATPTAAPTEQPSPTVGADADAAVRAFLADLVAAIRSGDVASMAARLDGAVIDRYGVAACEAKLPSDLADPTYAIDVLEIHPLGPWDYVTDERTTTIEGAWTVDANVTAAGEITKREVHVAPMDGGVSWFTDCGDPLPVP